MKLMEIMGTNTVTTPRDAGVRISSYDKAARILRVAEEKGFVKKSTVKRGRGHPEHLYSLTLPRGLCEPVDGAPLKQFLGFLTELGRGVGAEAALGSFVSTTCHGMAVLQPEVHVHATPAERELIEQFLEGVGGGLEPYRVILEERTPEEAERAVLVERGGFRFRVLSATDTVLESLRNPGVYELLGALHILYHGRVFYDDLAKIAVGQGNAARLGALLDVVREEGGKVPKKLPEILRYFTGDERGASMPEGFEEAPEYTWVRERWRIRFGLTRDEIRHHVVRGTKPSDWLNWILSADRKLRKRR